MIYSINLPNDHNSESDSQALAEQFPEFADDGGRLQEAAFDEIHRLWPGLEMLESTDFGGIFESSSTPPETLPRWAWVTEMELSEGRYASK